MSRYCYHIIKKILDNNMDLVEPVQGSSENTSQNHIAAHSNIRGAQAFF